MCDNSACPYYRSTGEDCPAEDGCGGFTAGKDINVPTTEPTKPEQYTFPDPNLFKSDEWVKLMDITYSDICGHASEWDNPIGNVNDRGGYENEVFAIKPCLCGGCNSPEADEPNFIYKPLMFEIRWDVYPFSSSTMNKNYSPDSLKAVWRECIKSVEENDE